MYIPRKYGQSRIGNCPFCGKACVTKNIQGIPVCQSHKNNKLRDLKCACGDWLDLRNGKWGCYFYCMNCGNVSFKKGIEMNPKIKQDKKEITITSDQVDIIY